MSGSCVVYCIAKTTSLGGRDFRGLIEAALHRQAEARTADLGSGAGLQGLKRLPVSQITGVWNGPNKEPCLKTTQVVSDLCFEFLC